MTFEYLRNVLNGSPSVSEDGLTLTQNVTVTSGVVGNTYEDKFIQSDNLDTTFPSTGMDVTQIIASIEAQCIAFVATTYPAIP
jgi:hypothetical protein